MRRKWLLTGIGVMVVLGVLLGEAFPLITGYGAKVMCSAVFVSGRKPEAVADQDLGHFPFNMGRFAVDRMDSSVTGTIWGLAASKAIYRKGLGATLINGLSEQELRRQVPSAWLPIVPAVEPDTVDWPQGDRVRDTVWPSEMSHTAVDKFLDQLFTDGFGTRAVIVLYNDRIIGERYAPGFTQQTPLAGWSMAKGITNALLGILNRDSLLGVDERAPIAAWQNDQRRNITIADLMHMRSGLRWWEFYLLPDACSRMLFAEKDMGMFAARCGLRHVPGQVFNYSSGTVNILSYVMRNRVAPSLYYKWPYEQLFYRIGMSHTVMEPDAGGTFVGSSYCYATARDWARFGLLYLHDGVWMGRRILPEGWVKYTREGDSYGALWWLNNGRWPHVAADAFACEGYEGQFLWVIPSRKLVVVRLALQRDKLDVDKVLRWLM
jgi:CubicO group peptidase (beta-lactamase class C family)